jgi:Nickel/cobalt transporter regulator
MVWRNGNGDTAMAVKRIKDFGRLTALAVAIAAFAAPVTASAQEEGGRHRGRSMEAPGQVGDSGEVRSQPRAERPSWRGGGGGEARVAPQPRVVEAAPAPAVAARGSWDGGGRRGGGSAPSADAAPGGSNGDWQGRRSGGDGARRSGGSWQGSTGAGTGGGWNGGSRRDRTPEAVPQPRAPQPEARSGGTWGSRDGTYRDGRRDGSYGGDRRRGETWRDGNHDGTPAWRGGDSRRSGSDWQRDGRRDGYRDGNRDNHQRWDRNWRRDSRYNWDSYRRYNRSTFNLGIYYAPYRNYSYRRLSIGFFLDSLFLADRYWLDDPYQYRLPEVYGPYRWVRYYDDVLLVDTYSGEVVDVIYDFFY